MKSQENCQKLVLPSLKFLILFFKTQLLNPHVDIYVVFMLFKLDQSMYTFPLKKTRSVFHLQQKTTTENLHISETVR